MSTTFGYISAWAKESKEEPGLKTLLEEYSIPNSIMMSGNLTVKPEMLEELIAYLSEPGNCGQYGVKLDFALFYDESKSVAISGKLTTPYVKGEDKPKTSASSRARRTV